MSKTWWDDEGSVRTGFHLDGDELTIAHLDHQEVIDGVLKANREDYAMGSTYQSAPKGDFHLIARITPGVAQIWKTQYGVDIHNPDHFDAIMDLIHHPDFQGMRVSPGEYRKRAQRQFLRASTAALGMQGSKKVRKIRSGLFSG